MTERANQSVLVPLGEHNRTAGEIAVLTLDSWYSGSNMSCQFFSLQPTELNAIKLAVCTRLYKVMMADGFVLILQGQETF